MSRSGSLLDALDSVATFHRGGGAGEDVRESKKRRRDKDEGDELTTNDKKTRNHGAKDKDRKRQGNNRRREEKEAKRQRSTGDEKERRREKRRRKRKEERKGKKRRTLEESDSGGSESGNDANPTNGQSEGNESDGESSGEGRGADKGKRRHKRGLDGKNGKDRKQQKKKRRRRDRVSSEDLVSHSDDGDDDDDDVEDSGSAQSVSDAENGGSGKDDVVGEAKAILSKMMAQFGDIAGDMKQLLGMIDSGQAVDIRGLPDPKMRASLASLLKALNLQKSPLGLFSLPQGGTPTLEVLSLVLNPGVSDPGVLGSKEPPANGMQPAGKEGEKGRGGEPKGETAIGTEDERRPVIGAAMPTTPRRPSLEESGTTAGGADSAKSVEPVIGPAGAAPEAGPRKRVVGPAMPSAEMLAAAAKLTEAQRALEEAEEEMENEPLIGPAPPAAAMEAENATEAERFEQVARILAPEATPYDILGVSAESGKAELKKRYWKLSLLVHPDKCSHPQAQQAFTALNQALKDLQDPTKRAIVDGKIEQRKAKEEYEAQLKARKEAAEWRRLRGEAVPGDDEILDGPVGPRPRDTWMTELPPEREARQATTNTFFSRKEKTGRGDTSAWTDTPEEKAKKAQQMYLEAYNQARLQGPTAAEVNLLEQQKAMKAAELLDRYNENKRAVSLVEAHHARQVEASKKKRKKDKEKDKEKHKGEKRGEKTGKKMAVGRSEEGTWVKDHPWRPWNRDTDLEAGRKSVKLDKKDLMAQGLTSRFSAGNPGERKFL